MAKIGANSEWSSSTAVKYKDEPQILSGPGGTPATESNPPKKPRQSILQRLTNMGKMTVDEGTNEPKATGSRLLSAIVKIIHNNNLEDQTAEDAANGTNNNAIRNEQCHSPSTSNRIEKLNSSSIDKANSCSLDADQVPPPLNTVVTVFHHKNSYCYEVITYDVDKKRELNRLYVPDNKIAELTVTKQRRMSFLGGGQASSEEVCSKLSKHMVFSQSKGSPYVNIMLPNDKDAKGKEKSVSISIPKPRGVSPAVMEVPQVNEEGTLIPVQKKVSIFQNVGKRFSIFGNNKPAPVGTEMLASFHKQTTPQKKILPGVSLKTNFEMGSGDQDEEVERSKEIPRRLSSNQLMNSLEYDKSVDTMLTEAAQMRVDLAAKRAAKKQAKEEGGVQNKAGR